MPVDTAPRSRIEHVTERISMIAPNVSDAKNIAVASVVTVGLLNEFLITKFSFDLFHANYHWYVRCDRASLPTLMKLSNITCTVFALPDSFTERIDTITPEFNKWIVFQKMGCIEDAFKSDKLADVVMFLDADLIFTDGFYVPPLSANLDLILSPHYRCVNPEAMAAKYGNYNTGFLVVYRGKSQQFLKWWMENTEVDNLGVNEQGCLNNLPPEFKVRNTTLLCNVGFWRRKGLLSFPPIPRNCCFMHTHLFLPFKEDMASSSFYGFMHRVFAMECVRYLWCSPYGSHQKILGEIIDKDKTGWYAQAVTSLKYFETEG